MIFSIILDSGIQQGVHPFFFIFFSLMKVKVAHSCPTFVIRWTVAYQVCLSMGFFIQEYWSGSPFPSPGDLPDPGIEPGSLMSPALSGDFFTISATWEGL